MSARAAQDDNNGDAMGDHADHASASAGDVHAPAPQQRDECVPLNCASESVWDMTSSLLIDVPIAKTAAGFGIYFTKREERANAPPLLVVDGFVAAEHISSDDDDEQSTDDSEPIASTASPPLAHVLQLGDVLVGVNGVACGMMEPVAVVALLRAAPLGGNTLQFRRKHTVATTTDATTDANVPVKDVGTASITSSLLGALRKVTTKLKEGIDCDDETLEREQLARAQFEREWLAAFARLQTEYASKWATCTYAADEFCGLLYCSGDAQQRAYLLREYPLLMETWTGARAARDCWPAPRIAYSAPIEYASSSEVECRAIEPPRALREIRAPPSLQRVLESLRSEFAWRRSDVLVFEQQLMARDVFSCSDLVRTLEMRSGHFDRCFQSIAYPRLTSAICRSLLAHARHGAKADVCVSAHITTCNKQ